MKRSALILGKTPQFIRWAIEKPCELREHDQESLPRSTFRELRTLKALSDGLIEDRVFEDVCVHPGVKLRSLGPARGFLVEEVVQIYGSLEELDSCCLDCPANAAPVENKWAGCFGWLAASSAWSLDDAQHGKAITREDYPDLIRKTVSRELKDAYEESFENHIDYWYGLWQPKILHRSQLSVLLSTLKKISQIDSIANHDFNHLLDAVRRCLENQMRLHVELIPGGHSDGTKWKIEKHCDRCKCSVTGSRRCNGCGIDGYKNQEREFNVLGFHPFLQLEKVWGKDKADEFVERYLNRFKS